VDIRGLKSDHPHELCRIVGWISWCAMFAKKGGKCVMGIRDAGKCWWMWCAMAALGILMAVSWWVSWRVTLGPAGGLYRGPLSAGPKK